ncbi:tRNA (N6-threonylcarbamoyladenosine(37)-N6)-methyltransferase TrmO [Amycolatopsis sp. DSM 110486]|uniref:tRNA (N6-threonylcarbamoyladenosine(37)-N6)-methyltransferase TrmO n=1 Tax=Amycolatopsis sp. DSM 110486 TaxID=2865832 RepID=UPI001C6A6D0E|nr:tRNA (N6-threonylcarbamoyladenosine(37)-N6)-methyltransferase TrmO [Amycolatopsis sp. DSM 110486]QYN19467.1 tRNA (N6-threonylcarbamoyladenosine(37)-N6)-methyltransferase TrmO [Amycolatopsis sp. DSM 110486]
MECPLPVVGYVRTARTELERTPVQAGANRGEEGVLELAEEYVEGLDGLAGFDYAWLLSWLDRPDRPLTSLSQVPYLLRREQRRKGIFAMRGPRRPNPIGLSLVRIVEVTGHTVRFAGVDLLDGTPILDLKPYVTAFDRPPGEPGSGWFDGVKVAEGTTPEDLAPPG